MAAQPVEDPDVESIEILTEAYCTVKFLKDKGGGTAPTATPMSLYPGKAL